MKTRLPALLAGALVLGFSTAATAANPPPLSTEQLDAVTAGSFTFTYTLQGDVLNGPVYQTHKEAVDGATQYRAQPGVTEVSRIYHLRDKKGPGG
jgi:hypothetical protein